MISNSVTVRLLGPPEILVERSKVSVDTRKAMAVLAMLALDEDGTLLRDHLVDLLWPGQPLSNARNSLRRTLSTLRSAVGAQLIEADRTIVSLDRDGIDLDTNAVEVPLPLHEHDDSSVCPACVPALNERIGHFRGQFMEGFFLRDAPGFDDWHTERSHHYKVLRGRLLERLAAGLGASGRFDEGADVALGRLALDPLDESAHRQRIEILGWAGKRAAARLQFTECVRVLEAELGVSPLPETVTLHDAVQAGSLAKPPVRPLVVRPSTAGAASRPAFDFVGRQTELTTVIDILRGPGSVSIVGLAGVGKTRLARESAHILELEGREVTWIDVSPGEGAVPFVVVRDAIEAGLDRFDGELPTSLSGTATIAPALVDRGVDPAVFEGSSARVRLLDSISAAFDVILGNSVLVLDNAQEADGDSIEAIAFALRRSRARRWGLCVISRDGHLDRLANLLEFSGSRVRLLDFTPEEVTELVQQRRGEVDEELATALFERTGGNPFFIDQCLRSNQPLVDLPAEVRTAVDSRINVLDPLATQVLGAAAVLGQAAPLVVLRDVSGRSEDETATALDLLVTEAFLLPNDAGFGIAHSIVRDAVGANLPPARRALLHGRCADLLRGRPSPDHAALAHHLAGAGRTDEAAGARWEAGVSALQVHANEAATDHFLHALALGHPDRAGVDAQLGDLAVRAGRYDDARGHYEQSLSHTRDADVLRRLAQLFRRWGRFDEARQTLHEAEALARDLPTTARVLLESAMVSFLAGDLPSAAATADRALGDLPDGEELLRASILNLRGLFLEGIDQALESLASAADAALRLEDESLLIAVLNNQARRLLSSDRAQEALVPAREALERAGRIGDRHHVAALHSNLADVLHALGETEEAMSHLRAAATGFSGVGADEWEPEIWMLTEW